MGLRGFKPSREIICRNRKIWRAYLRLRALRYNTSEQIYGIVAAAHGVTRDVVVNAVKMTDPTGCYDGKYAD